jgi:hypothetical protein
MTDANTIPQAASRPDDMTAVNDTIPEPLKRGAITDRAQWVVLDGPVSRGLCLAREHGPQAAEFIAPPGTPLQLPELMGALIHWRHGLVQEGRLMGEPTVYGVDEAIELAPANREWIERQVHEQKLRDEAIATRGGAPKPEPARDPRTESQRTLIIDGRPLSALTQSASRFSEIVEGLPSDSPVGQLERLLDSAISPAHLASEIDTLAFSIGRPASRELVVSLLHARARSHSWRYTRPFGVFERPSAKQQALAAEIAEASTAQELLGRIYAQGEIEQELDEALTDLLYARSKSIRWRATLPLRLLLSIRHLRGVRRTLRRAQAAYASLREGRPERRLKSQAGR